MATITETVTLDDLDGTPGATTLVFGLDGATYEVDLSETNMNAIRPVLDNLVAKGRRVDGKSKTRKTSGSKTTSNASKVREWARANGHEVGERGRIPSEVREAYAAAHPQG